MAEKPEDLNLPTAIVGRLIKEVLPEGINISKEARAAISKSASVFVLYATSCANALAMKHKRKTLTANDVLDAMEEMEFPSFIEPLKEGLEVFKREQKGKKDAAELKRKQKESEKKDTMKKQREDGEIVPEGDENTPVSENSAPLETLEEGGEPEESTPVAMES